MIIKNKQKYILSEVLPCAPSQWVNCRKNNLVIGVSNFVSGKKYFSVGNTNQFILLCAATALWQIHEELKIWTASYCEIKIQNYQNYTALHFIEAKERITHVIVNHILFATLNS